MGKSLGNAIYLSDSDEEIAKKSYECCNRPCKNKKR